VYLPEDPVDGGHAGNGVVGADPLPAQPNQIPDPTSNSCDVLSLNFDIKNII